MLFRRGRARRDQDGYYWVMGRVDDVLNVAGHRLSTMEVESALVSHPLVAEAAVVGFPHDIKGEGICCFVIPRGEDGTDADKETLIQHVRKHIGAGDAGPDPVHARAAEDPFRQDHAAALARHRRREVLDAGHDDAGGLLDPGEAARG